MAQWHLDDLRRALEKRGWRIAEQEGDGYRFSARWSLSRANDARMISLDFDGMDQEAVLPLPLPQSYACSVDALSTHLYFTRRGEGGSMARRHWEESLAQFVRALEAPAP